MVLTFIMLITGISETLTDTSSDKQIQDQDRSQISSDFSKKHKMDGFIVFTVIFTLLDTTRIQHGPHKK